MRGNVYPPAFLQINWFRILNIAQAAALPHSIPFKTQIIIVLVSAFCHLELIQIYLFKAQVCVEFVLHLL